MSEKLSLHKQSLHTFGDSIKDELLKRVGFFIIFNEICKIESIYIQKKAVIILGYVYSLSILDYLNYQFTGARLTGIVIQRAPPPPRGSSAASKVTTKRS